MLFRLDQRLVSYNVRKMCVHYTGIYELKRIKVYCTALVASVTVITQVSIISFVEKMRTGIHPQLFLPLLSFREYNSYKRDLDEFTLVLTDIRYPLKSEHIPTQEAGDSLLRNLPLSTCFGFILAVLEDP